MIIKPFGDGALLIEFEQEISPEINSKVIALQTAIQAAKLKGIQAYIPAYNSLCIRYNSQKTSYSKLLQRIQKLSLNSKSKTPARKLTIPICYAPTFALDLEELSQTLGISATTIIQLHQSMTYRVYMLGFLPGFAYMGTLPQALHCHRKESPRLKIPKGALGLAGQQTGIYPSESPGGWQIIGRCPIPLFDTTRAQPFLFQAGDEVQFKQVSLTAYAQWEKRIKTESNWMDLLLTEIT